jgi:hypothetical protein
VPTKLSTTIKKIELVPNPKTHRCETCGKIFETLLVSRRQNKEQAYQKEGELKCPYYIRNYKLKKV